MPVPTTETPMPTARNLLTRHPAALAALCLPLIPATAIARADITPVPIEPGQTRIEIVYHDPRSHLAKVVFQCCVDGRPLPWYVNLLRRRGDSRLTRLLGSVDLPIREAGLTITRSDRQPDVFYRAEADSGDRRIREIGIVVPWSFTFIGLRLVRDARTNRIVERQTSPGFDDPALRDERAFLLALEREGLATPGAGRVTPVPSAVPADPAARGDSTAGRPSATLDLPAVFRAWMADNDGIVSGRMTIRRERGLPAAIGDVTDSLHVGATVVSAHFRSGVIASDRRAGESWALFHSHEAGAWPTALVSAGRWIVIGTHGEGLACVDPQSFELRRLPLDPSDQQVVTLEARGDSIVVNGRRRVALPSR